MSAIVGLKLENSAICAENALEKQVNPVITRRTINKSGIALNDR